MGLNFHSCSVTVTGGSLVSYKHCCWTTRRDKVIAPCIAFAYCTYWRLVSEINVNQMFRFQFVFFFFFVFMSQDFLLSANSYLLQLDSLDSSYDCYYICKFIVGYYKEIKLFVYDKIIIFHLLYSKIINLIYILYNDVM